MDARRLPPPHAPWARPPPAGRPGFGSPNAVGLFRFPHSHSHSHSHGDAGGGGGPRGGEFKGDKRRWPRQEAAGRMGGQGRQVGRSAFPCGRPSGPPQPPRGGQRRSGRDAGVRWDLPAPPAPLHRCLFTGAAAASEGGWLGSHLGGASCVLEQFRREDALPHRERGCGIRRVGSAGWPCWLGNPPGNVWGG